MPNIASRRQLEGWLDGKPRDWSQAVALRTALRIFPLSSDTDISRKDQRLHHDLVRAACRAGLVASVATKYPNVDAGSAAHRAFAEGNRAATYAYRGATFRTPDAAAQVNKAAAAAHVTAYAARAAASGAHAAAAAAVNAVNAAANAVRTDAADVWRAVEADCRQLGKGTPPRALLTTDLWARAPVWWDAACSEADRFLLQSRLDFDVWAQWYEGRKHGSAFEFADFDEDGDREFAARLVAQGDDWWGNWSKVNATISQWAKEITGPRGSAVEYFISYANEEEHMAREVASVLEDLGHTYVVQYRDFPKRNFVTAINDGLASANALISLYSKAYVRSKHCQAEWNHHYNLDPSSEDRRIVAFLLEPTDLKPLMRQIVYCDLAGLGLSDRRKKIREWLEWKPLPLSRERISEIVQRTLSPQLEKTENGKFDVAPDPHYDKAEFPSDLNAALAELRMLLDIICEDSLNLPRIMRSAVTRYSREIEEVGAHSAWGGLDRLITIIAETLDGLDARELPDGLEHTIKQLMEAHAKAMTALKDAGSRMRDLSSIPMDMQRVGGEHFGQFIEKFQEFFEGLSDQGETTERLDDHVSEVVDQGRDLAAEIPGGQSGDRPHPSRRQYVLYIGGMALGAFHFLGSSASIASTHFGEKLLVEAQELVDMFFRFIPM